MIERPGKVFSGELRTMDYGGQALTVVKDVEIKQFVPAHGNRILFYLDKDKRVVGATIFDSSRGLSVKESRDGVRYRNI